ncbi:EF-hand domain-containing protein [Pseudoxanthomonas indica]|uniref:EF hand n=1 Tax=Pseudoxanthomonas indica TaxID=428993 RepID=A0A1T5K3D6_9GAMM|nr:EF-hand domain-containing protein [Pseudoxanthomonas indica]GGD46206.1 hypothetical protein GCM10007235_17770 [Pseudoxanthomonas indica]SKC58035.1 EF hand [Pseudoxanthomonas indica]
MKTIARPILAVASALLFAGLAVPAALLAQEQETPPPKTHSDAPPAADPANPSPRAFQELDTDGDGGISKDEAAADPALTQAFGTLDQDADGKLTSSEYQAYKPAAPGG